MTSLRAVFWDVDGTLADTEMDGHRPAFNAAFEELGLPISWEPDLYSELLSIPGGLRRVREYLSRSDLPVREEQRSVSNIVWFCLRQPSEVAARSMGFPKALTKIGFLCDATEMEEVHGW